MFGPEIKHSAGSNLAGGRAGNKRTKLRAEKLDSFIPWRASVRQRHCTGADAGGDGLQWMISSFAQLRQERAAPARLALPRISYFCVCRHRQQQTDAWNADRVHRIAVSMQARSKEGEGVGGIRNTILYLASHCQIPNVQVRAHLCLQSRECEMEV